MISDALRNLAPRAFATIAEKRMPDFMAGIGGPGHPSRILAAERLAACGTVLDIGCGPAVFWTTLHRVRPEIEYRGIDPVARMFDYAPIGCPKLEVGHAEKLPYEAESFDGVLLRHVLEHIEDPRDALAEAVRVCSRDLVVVFSQWTNDRHRLLTDSHLRAARFSHVAGNLLGVAKPLELIARYRWTPTGLRDARGPVEGAANLAPREELWHLSRRPVESLAALEVARTQAS